MVRCSMDIKFGLENEKQKEKVEGNYLSREIG